MGSFVDSDRWYLFWHNGGLLPVTLLVIMGGALGFDPIAKYIFQSKLFLTLGRISYSQYLLQYLVMEFLGNQITNTKQKMYVFPFVLLAVAYLMERYVTRVYTQFQRVRQEKGEIGWDERCFARVDKALDYCLS